jgi:Leucine-rich repeat (LRR) protein
MNQNRLNQIHEKLLKLKEQDKEFKIFGSSAYAAIDNGHHYQLNPTLSEVDLSVFESTNQIELPEEYRAFLNQIANGGAGPYYGLYSLEKGIEEATDYSTDENTPIENSFAIDFPISKAETEKFMQYYNDCIAEGEDDSIEYLEIPEPLTGVIFLSEYGCGWSYLLVVKGEMAGSVWLHGDYFCPVFVEDELWTFFDWYEDWLDRSLAELGPKKKTKTEFDPTATIINYDGWRLTEIPAGVFECKNLKKLVFSRNNLEEFPKKIIEFKELRVLDLSMTPIVEIPAEIGELKNLKKLHLNYNYHLDLPQEIKELQYLEEVSMYYNYKISAIPEVLTHLPKLKKLHFSYCTELKTLPKGIGNLSNLELLQLNDTALEVLPKEISQLRKLRFLYIDNTKIQELPEGFENLENLEALGINIAQLDLEKAVEKIKNLPKLKWLRIVLQKDYPTNFSQLIHIQQLTIQQNYDLWRAGFEHLPVPENLTLIPNLEELDMMNTNQANCLPESIGNLKSLKKLHIGSTTIQSFPESMQKLTQMEQIEGGLNQDRKYKYGIFPEEKEKLIQWFPQAKIWIW